MATGQVTWENQGYGSSDNIVSFETSKNIFMESRKKSIVGRLSKNIESGSMVGAGPHASEADLLESAAVLTKEITSGDEARFTLERTLGGAPTYGAAKVRMGDFVAYMHASIFINQTDSPAFPLQDEMSMQRVKDVLPNQESRLRNQISLWTAEETSYKFYDALLKGASADLMSTRSNGGRALNLGLGAGVQVSPEHFIVAGNGPVAGTPGTSGYETNLDTALSGLTNTAGDMITLNWINNLPYYLSDINIEPISGLDGTNEAKYYIACDPDLLTQLTALTGDLSTAWKAARERSASNPFFNAGTVEWKNLVFMPDPYIKKFRADLSGPTIVWGSAAEDRRSFNTTSNLALMFVLGNMSMLEGHNGSVAITEDKGFHGKGKSISAHYKTSFQRTRWVAKDGSGAAPLVRNMVACAFYQPGLNWG